jgi:serine/threonine-protein phosphatase 2A regulatory subunit B
MSTCERVVTATPKRTFSNAHAYHINSISLNSDGESFMSCDDLRLNLWNLRVNTDSFNIVDVKPANMEALSEVITSASFHPVECQTFIYSSSRGCVRLGDMRASALCDKHAKVFEAPEDPANKSFFSEITSSISSARFSHDGRFVVTRDYMTAP